jgi:hypothetical protein
MSIFSATTFYNIQPAAAAGPTFQFRNDPYSASLQLAMPGTLFSSLGMSLFYSDVSANIRGTGSNVRLIPSQSAANSPLLFPSQSYVNTQTYDFANEGYTTSIYQGGAQNVGAVPVGAFPFSNGNFVVEGYIRFTSALSAPPFNNFMFGDTSGDNLLIDHNSGGIRFFIEGTNEGTSNTYTQNEWTHWAFVRSGSNVYVYKNGTRIKSDTTSATIAGAPYWGILGWADANLSNGAQKQINDFKIYIGTDKGYTGATITPPNSIVQKIS